MSACASLFTPRDAHNYRVFSMWMMGGCFVFAAATILIDGKFIPAAAGWALTATTAVLAIAAMRSYIHFLRHADELLRKVHLESLALAFGTGLIGMMVWRLCERLGAPKLDVNDAALIMILTWAAGQWLGSRRYALPAEQQ